MAVIIIDNLNKRLNELSNPQDTLMAVGNNVQKEVVSNWNRSLGGDGTPFKPLTPKYKNYKLKVTGNAIPNMRLTGKMQKVMKTRKRGKYAVVIGFSPGQQPKADGNATKRPNMMTVSDKTISYVNKFILDRITK